jgi:Xaa-Pro aminopeptidase
MSIHSSPCRFCIVTVAALLIAAPTAAQPPAASHALRWQIPVLDPPAPIGKDEYAARRMVLMDALGEGVLLVPGAPPPAADYLPFHQSAAFRYLTGITEPGAALVMQWSGGRVQEWLFVQRVDPAREVWEGARLGPDSAAALTGIPALTSDRITVVLDSLLQGAATFFVTAVPPESPGALAALDYEQQVIARTIERRPGIRVRDASNILAGLRARKSPAELDLIRRAVYITAAAHREAMKVARPAMNEFEIRALIEYVFARNGAEAPAFASIVGSGPNTTTLHYNADDRFIRDSDLLLMDVGASYGGYAADVTRTIPAAGGFTREQRDIYEIVLAAQKAAEQRLRPGAEWQELRDAANGEIAAGLARLRLIDSPDATYDCGEQQCPQYRLFFMHGLGHGVGLDVHDPDISSFEGFQPGSAVTIEPGIYVRRDVLDHLADTPANRAMIERLRPALARYADIGVRIEDVYLFGPDGVERASAGVPREPDEVQLLMREASAMAEDRRGDVVSWYRSLRRH